MCDSHKHIVERLRSPLPQSRDDYDWYPDVSSIETQRKEAADEIERLNTGAHEYQRQLKEARAKIEWLTVALKGLLIEWDKLTRYGSPIAKAANERVNAARNALEEK